MMRLLKQFLYGTFFLIIFGSVAWGVYSVALKPVPSCFDGRQNGDELGADCGGSCISCEVKNLRPLFVSDAVLHSADRVYSVSVRVQNSSPDFGARNFSYAVNYYDLFDDLIESVSGKSFIYPGGSKDLIEAGARITGGIPSRAELVIDDSSIEWVGKDDFSEPRYELKDVGAELENGQVVVSGAILNPNNFQLTKVVLSAFLSDKLGFKAGASRTELNNVGQFRQDSFKIFIPVQKEIIGDVDLDATAKSVSVSVLK